MAFIDFSLDSRIRKRYVPLITQQRFMRHVTRIAARNLCIPNSLMRTLIDKLSDTELKNFNLNLNEDCIDGFDNAIEQSQSLILRLNISFYFTILYPSKPNCEECLKPQMKRLCNCNKLLYRSELISNPNPSWRPFDGSTFCSPSISNFIIRIYYKQLRKKSNCGDINITYQSQNTFSSSEHSENVINDQSNTSTIANNEKDESNEKGTLFLEWAVHLSGLVHIGEEIPKDRRLSINSIIFGAHEGFYTSLDSINSDELLNHIVPPTESMSICSTMVRRSYCSNTLTRIQMVQYIYQATAVDMQRSKNALQGAIERTRVKRELAIKIEKLQSSIEFLTEIVKKRNHDYKNSQEQLANIENDIFELNATMSNRVQILKEEINRLFQFRSEKLLDSRKRLEYVRHALVHRRRLLAKDLFQDVYRIIPFPDSRGYSICGVFLPDAERIDEHDPKMISIALGHVTHLLAILSSILDINLNYQLIPFGSRSMIIDSNNHVLRENEKFLPLHSRSGKNAIFFKYGLYLLNRTIAYIRRSVGLKTHSVAMTLSNLYTLFTDSLLVDNYNINSDFTFNRFSIYSPSFDLLDPSMLQPDSIETWNQHFLNDINFIKDNDCMIDYLWKEVEQLTLNGIINKPESNYIPTSRSHSRANQSLSNISRTSTSSLNSSSSSSPNVSQDFRIDEIKNCITKHKQRRRELSTHRLSQITSSLSSSYASASSSAPSRILSTKAEDIIRQRRISVTNCYTPESNNQSFLNNSPESSCHFVPNHRRIRSVSGYGWVPFHSSSVGSNKSFVHGHASMLMGQSRNSTPIQSVNVSNINRNLLTGSLDKGLNRLLHHQSCSSSSITSSFHSLSNQIDLNSTHPRGSTYEMPSSYLNIEMLKGFGLEDNRSIDESMKVLAIDERGPNNSWLHSSSSPRNITISSSSNDEYQPVEKTI